ncbi:MAG TPA: carboxypeptidase regulatory-like domain-containing protein, partial [Chitinophagaceae bacterium]|nr:carboxypeptidase regulatory-like domain-containing protein [Chitinophagaceae bacterium]
MAKATFFLLLFVNSTALAQTISGKVQDTEKRAVPLANVLLLQARDSSLVKGSVTDESGKYIIETSRPGTYFLAISRIGFNQQYTSAFSVTSKSQLTVPAFTLTAATKQLNEVTVTGKRPFVENKIDRLVVNVANSIIASGSTALEVLEKAPGVTVDRQNDQISLRGKEGVIVQIDGKQTYLPMADVVALLRNMPSDNIDRIELITNPSAKYDAAGNSGIIDIRLKKNNNVGTNGSASVGAGSGRYHRERA